MKKINIIFVALFCCLLGFFVFGCGKKNEATNNHNTNNNEIIETLPNEPEQNEEDEETEKPSNDEDASEEESEDLENQDGEEGTQQPDNENKFEKEERQIEDWLKHSFSFGEAEIELSNLCISDKESVSIDIETVISVDELLDVVKNNFADDEIISMDSDNISYFFISLKINENDYEIFLIKISESFYTLSITLLVY